MAAAAASFTPSSTDGGLASTCSICRSPNCDFTNVWNAMTPLLRWWERPGQASSAAAAGPSASSTGPISPPTLAMASAPPPPTKSPSPDGPARGAGVDRRPRGVGRPAPAPPPPLPAKLNREPRPLAVFVRFSPSPPPALTSLPKASVMALSVSFACFAAARSPSRDASRLGLEQSLGDVEPAHVVEQVRHHERLQQGVAVAERGDGKRVLHREDGVGSGPDRRRTDPGLPPLLHGGDLGREVGDRGLLPLPEAGDVELLRRVELAEHALGEDAARRQRHERHLRQRLLRSRASSRRPTRRRSRR